MAHDFLGTFNKTQWERFLAFARSQIPLVDDRIAYLSAEMRRIGTLEFDFDASGKPTQFFPPPQQTYLGKLLAAYEVLGGNPFMDLRTRTKSQAVFVLRGSETVGPHTMSNGEVIGARGLADAPTAEYVRKARGWLDGTMRARFERLERKIRRAIDYADELQTEIDYLTKIKAAVTTEDSLEYIAEQIAGLIADPNYRAIFDDQGRDPLGLTSYAPFSSYDVDPPLDPNIGGQRTVEAPQRQDTGFIGPGETQGSGVT